MPEMMNTIENTTRVVAEDPKSLLAQLVKLVEKHVPDFSNMKEEEQFSFLEKSGLGKFNDYPIAVRVTLDNTILDDKGVLRTSTIVDLEDAGFPFETIPYIMQETDNDPTMDKVRSTANVTVLRDRADLYRLLIARQHIKNEEEFMDAYDDFVESIEDADSYPMYIDKFEPSTLEDGTQLHFTIMDADR